MQRSRLEKTVQMSLNLKGLALAVNDVVLVTNSRLAYDTQKLKMIGQAGFADGESRKKAAILGALTLYLDFINLFLMLLRIMGNRR